MFNILSHQGNHAGEDAGKGQYLFIAGGSENWYSQDGNSVDVPREGGINLHQSPAIPVSGIYPKDS